MSAFVPASALASHTSMVTVRALLDDALLGLRGITDAKVPVHDAERDVGAALAHAYRALACGGDYQRFYTEAEAAKRHVQGALAILGNEGDADPGVAAETALVAHALRALGNVAYVVLDVPPDLPRGEGGVPVQPALRDEPKVIHAARDVLYPVVPLPTLPPPPPPAVVEPAAPPAVSTLAQLEALMAATAAETEAFDAASAAPPDPPKPAPAALPPPATDDEAVAQQIGVEIGRHATLFDRARLCLEDMATFGVMRRPLEGEGQSWTGRALTEQRLLARVDAIVACGPRVLPRLVKLLELRPMPDPDLTWAVLFLFGSFAGDDTLDQVVRVVRASPLDDPEMVDAVSDALTFAPHPGLEARLRTWLADADAGRRVVAVRALGRRRALMAEEALAATSDPDARVVLAGAVALGAAHGEIPHGVFAAAMGVASEPLLRAAIVSATMRKVPTGVRHARDLTERGYGGYADAAMFTAISAGHDALASLLALDAGVLVRIEALGWFGSVEAVEPLLVHLAEGAPAVKTAAVIALQRLTDASLTEARPEPTYEKGDEPFARAYAPPTDVDLLVEDPEVWRAWWVRHGKHAQAGVRYRFGHAWSPRDCVGEMAHPMASARNRRWAWMELMARTGGTLPFDPDDFVVRQRAEIAAWEAFVAARAGRATQGSWTVRLVEG